MGLLRARGRGAGNFSPKNAQSRSQWRCEPAGQTMHRHAAMQPGPGPRIHKSFMPLGCQPLSAAPEHLSVSHDASGPRWWPRDHPGWDERWLRA